MGFLSDLWNGAKEFAGITVDAIAGMNIPIVSDTAGAVSGYLDEKKAQKQHESDLDWSAEQAQINRDFQTSERLAAQQYQLDMWNLSNQYNSPEGQLERAAKAGINLNDVIGKGSQSYAQPMSSHGQAGATASFPNDSLATALLTNDAVLRNLYAQSRKTDSETALNNQQYSWNSLEQPQRYKMLLREYEKMGKEIEKYDVDISVAKGMFDWYSKLSEEEIKIMQQKLNNMRNENLEILQRIDESKSKEFLNYKQGLLAGEQAELADQQTYESIHRVSLIDEQAVTQSLQNDLLTIEKNFSSVTGIPLGTSEFETMFNLWKKGQIWDFYNAIATNGLNSLVGAAPSVLTRGRGMRTTLNP